MGNMDAKINETTSKTMNLLKSNPSLVNDNVKQIIKNNGMQMIGGLVNVEICFAILNLFMFILYDFIIYNHESKCQKSYYDVSCTCCSCKCI
jgi:hypothetical protein